MNRRTASKIMEILEKRYKTRIYRENPFRVLIGVMLSHQTTDKMSVPATERLLKKANTPKKIVEMPEKEIAKTIYPVGFYNVKAKRIRQVCKILFEKYDGKVPRNREELVKLPGIGPKSASIVLSFAFGIPTIAVDTHIHRISKRLKWVPDKTTPEKTQPVIERLIPRKYHLVSNHTLVSFGREICTARKPKCYMCPIEKHCPYPLKNMKPPKIK